MAHGGSDGEEVEGRWRMGYKVNLRGRWPSVGPREKALGRVEMLHGDLAVVDELEDDVVASDGVCGGGETGEREKDVSARRVRRREQKGVVEPVSIRQQRPAVEHVAENDAAVLHREPLVAPQELGLQA